MAWGWHCHRCPCPRFRTGAVTPGCGAGHPPLPFSVLKVPPQPAPGVLVVLGGLKRVGGDREETWAPLSLVLQQHSPLPRPGLGAVGQEAAVGTAALWGCGWGGPAGTPQLGSGRLGAPQTLLPGCCPWGGLTLCRSPHQGPTRVVVERARPEVFRSPAAAVATPGSVSMETGGARPGRGQ